METIIRNLYSNLYDKKEGKFNKSFTSVESKEFFEKLEKLDQSEISEIYNTILIAPKNIVDDDKLKTLSKMEFIVRNIPSNLSDSSGKKLTENYISDIVSERILSTEKLNNIIHEFLIFFNEESKKLYRNIPGQGNSFDKISRRITLMSLMSNIINATGPIKNTIKEEKLRDEYIIASLMYKDPTFKTIIDNMFSLLNKGFDKNTLENFKRDIGNSAIIFNNFNADPTWSELSAAFKNKLPWIPYINPK